MIKKISLVKISTFFLFLFSQAKADVYEEYLEDITTKFHQASTLEEKFEIISRSINSAHLQQITSLKDLDESKLEAEVRSGPFPFIVKGTNKKKDYNASKTTPLSLAISLGKVHLVEEFLKVVSNVNDTRLTAWGHCQPYTLAHMALHPHYPKASQPVPLEDKLAIIDLLGKKGANFNAILKPDQADVYEGVYLNPPLAAGSLAGVNTTETYPLQARALLYGADPNLHGSSFAGVSLKWSTFDRNNLIRQCLKQYLEKVSQGEMISPLPIVLTHLKDLAKETGFDLEEKVAQLKVLPRLTARKEENDIKITELKPQKTKKSKRKLEALGNIQQELEREIAQLNKATARLLRRI